MSSTKPLRLRIFAGPNGSGKSTIIESIRRYQVFGRNIDLGIYINADDIAYRLQHSTLDFGDYDIKATKEEFIDLILDSGLINTSFPQTLFINSFEIKNNHMVIDESYHVDRISQIISEFLRRKLLIEKKKFSVETVFSHRSKIDFMMKAGSMGYRIYLYYISTKDPEINKYRVELRVKQGGHPVPPDKIKPRYYRSLELLYDAAQLSYKCYLFDNSGEDKKSEAHTKYFAHFKVENNKKIWNVDKKNIPNWFYEYYSVKAK